MPVKTDIMIIGGGVAGASIARELSKYQLDVILAEKEADVGWGQTKASYAMCHPGARWPPGTLAQKMIAEANGIMNQFIDELDIEFKKTGELGLAFNKDELNVLKIIKKQGEHIKVPGLEIIGGDEVRRLEPRVNPKAVAALYMPSAGLFNPFDVVHALFENARDNGVRMMLNTEVIGIVAEDGQFIVDTDQGQIQTSYVVNASGLYAQKVAQMVGADEFEVSYATKSTCLILDSSLGHMVSHIVNGFADLQKYTSFKLVMPTYGGNLLIYTPIPVPAHGIDDCNVHRDTFERIIESARDLLPGVDFEKFIIASYSGKGAKVNRNDFIIEPSKKNKAFINVALPAPAVTCSPVIGRRVAEILRDCGVSLRSKADFNPRRVKKPCLRNASLDQIRVLTEEDSRYGRVVCRCEKVSEGEINDAISRGAATLDGVKFRTRAGMGKCQGNYCGMKVTEILARELRQPLKSITKKGPGSNILIPVDDDF